MSVAVTTKKPTDSMFRYLKEGTQLMTIYTPYFYIIQNIYTGIYYAGSRWAKSCNPTELLVEGGYLTSSNIVNRIIKKRGTASFVVRRIRVFTDGAEARRYETRFLQKINAKSNPCFYNEHNNDHLFSFHDEKYKAKMIEIYGVDNPTKLPEIKEKISIAQRGKIKPWLSGYNKSRIHPSLGMKMSKEFSEDTSERNRRVWSNYSVEEKKSRTDSISESVKRWNENRTKEEKAASIEKAAESNRGKYWWNNGIVEIKSAVNPGQNFSRGRIKKSKKPTYS